MVNVITIQRRLQKLAEYVIILEKLQKETKDRFLNDPFVYGNVERYLQLAIQCIIDISNHVLAEHNINGALDYRDMLMKMGKEGFLPQEFALRISPMAGLRNILVHDYLEIDRSKLYDILIEHIGDLKEFGKHISKLL